MTGQPLARFKDVTSFTFVPGSVFKRPILAPYVMVVIERWSLAETSMFNIASDALHAEPVIATAMLQAIDNQAAQRLAVLAAAKAVLDADDWLLFEAAFYTTNPSRNARNQFVHYLWGTSDQLPGALLLFDPKYSTLDRAKRIKRVSKRIKRGVHPVFAGERSIDVTGISVWREADFKCEAKNAERAQQVIADLGHLVSAKRVDQPTDSIRKRLLNDSLVQQRLHRASPKT